MKRLLFIPLLLLGGCLWGCQGAGPKNFDEAMILVGQMQKVAEAQGIAWTATVSFDGRPRFFEEVAFGFDTGLDVTFRMQGNAMPQPK